MLLEFACKEPYTPPAIATANNTTLVVEGNINISQDSTIVRLTNTKNLNDTGQVRPVTGAEVMVQGNDGSSFPLQEQGNGYYTAAAITGSTSAEYRLSIATPNGKQYTSAYVPFLTTPAIDSITWVQQNDGVHILANTHDDNNNTRYYRWDYVETWENDAPFESQFIWIGGDVSYRDSSQLTYRCYKSSASSNVVIFSTNQLAKDVVYEHEIAFIPVSTEKLGAEYSIQANQYALTGDAYNYWQLLSTNTENLGTLFDAKPSQITGNIHCVTDTAEVVLGYVGASSRQQKRIFISRYAVEPWQYPPYPFSICDTIVARTYADEVLDFGTGEYVPVGQLPSNGPYWGAPPTCVDCRLNGGTLTKPPFWP